MDSQFHWKDIVEFLSKYKNIFLANSEVMADVIINATVRRWTARKGWREIGPRKGVVSFSEPDFAVSFDFPWNSMISNGRDGTQKSKTCNPKSVNDGHLVFANI